ncbi:MAG: hypothetical protein ACRC0X_09380 [Brevinema sp.]
MKLYTDNEDSLIVLTPINGGEEILLPGVLQNLSVNGEILIDSNNSASSGAPQKVMRGYKDRTVNISLRLLEVPKSIENDREKNVQTEIEKYPYDILEELNQLFQNKEDGIPIVYTLFNDHTVARGINEVLFTGLSSYEDNSTNTITVTLTFEEFVSAKFR